MNVSWILHRDFLEGNKKGHRFTLAVALYILTLRLPIPVPSKYPTPGDFPMGGVAETREAPSIEGVSFIFGAKSGGVLCVRYDPSSTKGSNNWRICGN